MSISASHEVSIAEPVAAVNPVIANYVAKQQAEAGLYKVGEKIHFVTGYGGNINFIEGDEGVIMVNTGSFTGWSEQAYAEFRQHSDKPIVAVIYTHGYPDHTGGARVFIPVDADREIPVYLGGVWRNYVRQHGGPSLPEVAIRGVSQMGYFVPPGEGGTMGSTLCRPLPLTSGASYAAPNRDVNEPTDVVIAGVSLRLIPAPHDVDDGLMVWMPDEKILFTGDILMPGFMVPTLATPRNEPRRDPQAWIQSMGLAASFGAETLIPAYGMYVSGADLVRARLVDQQKLGQHMIDETYRLLYAGFTSQEIAERLKIPAELERNGEYTELYHRLSWIVRSLISRDFGWYNGDPLDYVRLPASKRAQRFADEFGGLQGLIERARKAYGTGDTRWALELATEALLVDSSDADAKAIRIASMRAIAYASDSNNERNLLLTQVLFETGMMDRKVLQKGMGRNFSEASLLRDPVGLLHVLGPKLLREKVGLQPLWVHFELMDRESALDIAIVDGVMLRGGDVARIAPDLIMRMNYGAMIRGVEGLASFSMLIAEGEVEVRSGGEHIDRFISAFDW